MSGPGTWRREDLAVFTENADGDLIYAYVTDAELAELGYVRLDGIDVDALGRFVVDGANRNCGDPDAECWLQDSHKGWWQKDLGESIVAHLAATDQRTP